LLPRFSSAAASERAVDITPFATRIAQEALRFAVVNGIAAGLRNTG
jgi:hypothetical protein